MCARVRVGACVHVRARARASRRGRTSRCGRARRACRTRPPAAGRGTQAGDRGVLTGVLVGYSTGVVMEGNSEGSSSYVRDPLPQEEQSASRGRRYVARFVDAKAFRNRCRKGTYGVLKGPSRGTSAGDSTRCSMATRGVFNGVLTGTRTKLGGRQVRVRVSGIRVRVFEVRVRGFEYREYRLPVRLRGRRRTCDGAAVARAGAAVCTCISTHKSMNTT
jgi:hypothetical protein